MGLVTYILTTYIPAWHTGIPTDLLPLIPVMVALAGHLIGGYLATHTATADEIRRAVADASVASSEAQKLLNAVDPPTA